MPVAAREASIYTGYAPIANILHLSMWHLYQLFKFAFCSCQFSLLKYGIAVGNVLIP
uniref:Uncharacterized protein n=1 Tax=Arundo donax TaxID=35708 RepID=A0A0A9EB46_ARUDO